MSMHHQLDVPFEPVYCSTFMAGTNGALVEIQQKQETCLICGKSSYHRILTMTKTNELVECPRCGAQFPTERRTI